MQVMRRFITRAHVGRNVFVHLAPIEVGNATRTDVNSSTLQKESKHVKRSSRGDGWKFRESSKGKQTPPPNCAHTRQHTVSSAGRWRTCLGKGRRRAHICHFVVMDAAAFKVSHGAFFDRDTTALQAAGARLRSIGALE